MRTITLNEVVEAAQAVVTEAVEDFGPDVDYTTIAVAIDPDTNAFACVYTMENPQSGKRVPACLVGQVFDRLDMPLREVWEPSTDDAQGVVDHLEETGEVIFDPLTRQFLDSIQMSQDNENPWTVALNQAEVYVIDTEEG